ncbi:MAG: sigma-70 family RNA polymerase sigma factor [Pseudomonadota bacterium]
MSLFAKNTLNLLYQFGIALTGTPEDAEDVLHTALERYLANPPIDIKDAPAYVRTVMRHCWYDELRKLKTRRNYLQVNHAEQHDDTPIHLIEEDLESLMISEMEIARVWSQLEDPQRELLYLWCVLDYTAQEIANELGVPRGTILARLHRLKKSLRQQAEIDQQQGAGA